MQRLWCHAIAVWVICGCNAQSEEPSPLKQTRSQLVSVESLVGDQDGFGTGLPCGFQYQDINSFTPEADDPIGTDVIMVTSAYTPSLANNPHVSNPQALRPPAPLQHTLSLRNHCPIVSVELEMCTADIDDGPISWIDDQLFLDGVVLNNAFDTTNQYISGVSGYTGLVRFSIPASYWHLLGDGQLTVRVDELGRTTTDANMAEVLAIDYSRLRVQQDCSAFPDVVITQVEAEPSCINGKLSIQATVLNQGEAATSANLPVAFYRGNPASGGSLLGVATVSTPLAPGQSAAVQLRVVPDAQNATVYAVADDAGAGHGQQAESREDNNTASAQLTLTCTGAGCIEVRLSDYNLFLLGDYNGGHDVQGKVAAGGNVTLSDFAVGAGVPDTAIARTLVAGGTLSLSRGGVWGEAWYGSGYATSPSVTFIRGTASQGTPIDFAARGAELRRVSAQLARLEALGTTTRESWGGIMLRGTSPQVNVFRVDASAFTGAKLLSIDAPVGSLAVINIYGSSATFTGFGHSFSGGIDQRGVLFNFVDATDIDAHGYGFWGTVLAPNAHVSFHDGSFDGGIYAQSLTGNAEGHINPLSDRDICPEQWPGTWTQWLNRDVPSGMGDYEDLANFPNVCNGAAPIGIECATVQGVDWRQTGQFYECTPSLGGVCVNSLQTDGRSCLDYHVRFLCP